MTEPVQPIRPELLAAKLESIQNYEHPQLLEQFGNGSELVRVLWFLQYVSRPENYPGGLSKFAADLIASEHDLLGTSRAQQIRCCAAKYTVKEAVDVLKELPSAAREKLFEDSNWVIANTYDAELYRGQPSEHDALLLKMLTPASIRQMCIDATSDGLASYFKEVCELPHIGLRLNEPATLTPRDKLDMWLGHRTYGPPWYFVNIADALLSFIEKRRRALLQEIAETEVTRLIMRWITKSRNTRRSVMIIGNSRFGKTETIKLCAKADPGSCRLIDTREGNALRDLLREVARGLGLEFSLHTPVLELRERIDYVLRFSNLQLIFEESQFLLPATYSRNTAPARLNWVRRAIMDQHIPAVFVCTPQSYLPAKERFIKTTKFAMEQFDERFLRKPVQLPEELCESDLVAVARIHFPGLQDDYLRFVVDNALATERNFVSDIEKIATLAKDNAREHGRRLPILADIKTAMADVLPVALATGVIERPRADRQSQPAKRAAQRSILQTCTNGQKPMDNLEQITNFSRGVVASREICPT